ncbi:MAG: SH3 domain-containing protein [Chloroflexi bacterium]|nr:SH3 domain-containing protein [Chloroflexota bacterium]
MTNKKILLFLLPFVLACTITAPAAQIEPLPTISPTPPETGIPAPTATATREACKVTADSLNLRDAPDLAGYESHVIAWLYAGDVLTILPDPPVENWIFVQAENLPGWINSKYCVR